MIEGEDMW